ncbi:MAG: N-acetyltransferase [Tunicatimonas sp.]|uniref:GNAT family N-acetyltransferase n=1 Tax=Tunicatimonas sp. TaxID=1940096 RepID=UPI003C73ED92
MEILIRREESTDYSAVFKLIEASFQDELLSDHREGYLVERLRGSSAFVPELSLVAENDSNVIGYILLTKIIIQNNRKIYESLALAPVSVLPQYQRMGVGTKLIAEAHERAKFLGFKSVVLPGHQDYYSRFGYELASKYGIKLPFDVPEENCMAIELIEGGLDGVIGEVKYPDEFLA